METMNRAKMLTQSNGVDLLGYTFALQLKLDMYLRERVIEAAERQGLPVAGFREPTKRNSFKNAMRKQMKAELNDRILHFVEETPSAVVFQVDRKVLESANIWGYASDGGSSDVQANTATFESEYKVVYDKTSDRVVCENYEVLQEVYRLLEVYQTSYTKATLNRYILDLLEKNTNFSPYIKGTGVYFVPSSNKDYMTKIIDFMWELDQQQNCVLCEIPDLPCATDAVTVSVDDKVDSLVTKVEDEVLDLVKKKELLTKEMTDNRMERVAKTLRYIEESEVLLNRKLEKSRKRRNEVTLMVKTYHQYGTIENPFQKLVSNLSPEMKAQEAVIDTLKSEIPDDILELIDFS